MSPEERIEMLEKLLRPFAEAYRLHKNGGHQVSKFKAVMAISTHPGEWQEAFEYFYGKDVKEPVEET